MKSTCFRIAVLLLITVSVIFLVDFVFEKDQKFLVFDLENFLKILSIELDFIYDTAEASYTSFI